MHIYHFICYFNFQLDHADWMYKIECAGLLYTMGVQSFLKATESNLVKIGVQSIWCPCVICKNFKRFDDIQEIEFHLLKNGLMPRYSFDQNMGIHFLSVAHRRLI